MHQLLHNILAIEMFSGHEIYRMIGSRPTNMPPEHAIPTILEYPF